MVPFVDQLSKGFQTKKFIVVADRALNSNPNIDALVKLDPDYALAFKMRTASEKL